MSATCFVVGESALVVECVRVLVGVGFAVKGVVSPDRELREAIEREGLRFLARGPGWIQTLREEPFDYLFSIVNDAVLSADTLNLPRRLAINYHDGPLPAYAGVHATFWALANGETTHGVTWHVMRPEVDAGDVLAQVRFPLADDETSFSLNTRCFVAALDLFRGLVDDLAAGRVSPQPQDLSRRSYVGRNQRPDRRVDWHRPAAQLAALGRAFHFGFHPNPFGLLKAWVGDAVFLVQDVAVDQRAPRHSPGTVESVDSESLSVATADGVLLLRGWLTPDGEPVSVAALADRCGLRTGVALVGPTADETARWQNRADRCAPHQGYWVARLADFRPTVPEPVESLPPDRPAAAVGHLDVAFPPALRDSSTGFSPRERALCAFLVYLSRVSGDVRLGVGVSSEETRQAAAESGGLLADVVPFTVEVAPDADFVAACQRVRQELQAIAQRETFAREVLVAQPRLRAFAETFRRDGFPVEIQFQTGPAADAPPASPRGLTLVLPEAGPGRLWFNPAAWPESRAAELIRRWALLAEWLAQHPNQPVADAELLTADERHRLLHEWSSAPVPYPRDALVHQLVEEQAARRPDAVALRSGAVALTYDELNQRANALAGLLRNRGVGPDVLVGVCLDRSVEQVVSLLAILKAGGAYVPLDPAYPPARLAALQAQVGLRLVVTTAALAGCLAGTTADCLRLDDLADELARQRTDNPPPVARAEHLAYVLFTSGSTGQPKAVAVPHRAVVRLVNGSNFATLNESTVLLGMAPLAFDASTLELWGSLANGGHLVLLPPGLPSPDAVKTTVRAHGVTTVFFTSALFNVLVDSGIGELTSLREVMTGGDVVSPTHAARAYQQLPGCRFISVYGPTESTTLASFYPIPPGAPNAPTVPIGTPVSNTQLFVLNARQRLVPPGEAGELCIGGDGLARGYLNQPELTAGRFVPHPFSPNPGDRLYRTGDRARFRPDGCLEFLGRFDDQVKIRGFRIEPGEIETALCQHPAVREAVVVAREMTPGDKRLVAYVVLRPEPAADGRELRAFLQTRLPEHLIPAAWVPLDALPLTPNGKVDRKRLPPPVFSATPHASDTPRTATENALHALWTGLLQVPFVGADDSFFESGGNSLLALQLLGRIHQRMGVRLAVTDVFAHPTLRQLGALLDGLPREQPPGPGIFPNPSAAAEAPLSFAQRRLWVLHQLYDLGGTYNVPLVLRTTGPLNLPALQRGLEKLVQRHQALRTAFGHADGRPFQRVEAPFSVPIPATDLSAADPEAVNRWLVDEAHQPFDLAQLPLLRARVAYLGAETHLVLLVFHHLVFDGWSVRVLANELSAAYGHAIRGEEAPLPPLPVQYSDFARWQAAPGTPAFESSVTYWKNRLAGAPPLLALPADRPRPPVPTFAGDDVVFALPPDAWDALLRRFPAPDTTLFMRLLAVTAVWLGRLAATDDVVVGVPVAGRTRAETAGLIGFFVNTLVLRIGLSPGVSFPDLLKQVRQRALEAYEHQDLPFEQLVEALNPPRTLAYAPLVQVVVDVDEDTPDAWQLAGLRTEQLPFQQRTAKFDLHVSFRRTNGEWESVFNYNTDLFDRATVAGWADDFVRFVERLATEPAQPLALVQRQPLAEPFPAIHPGNEAVAAIEPPGVVTPGADALRVLWQRLLGVETVGWDDDFFELGGHSLLAFQLVAEWQRQTSQKLPIAALFTHPTLRTLSHYAAQLSPDGSPPGLVPIQPRDGGNALFFVHDVSGDVDYARRLTPYVGDRPVYGLESPGLHREGPFAFTIEELAAQHLSRVVAHQPEGPYALAGYSLGGVIAFEMARQLREAGRSVALLAVLDSYPITPDRSSLEHVPLRYVLLNYWNYWRTLPKNPAVLVAVVRKKLPALGRYLANRVRSAARPASTFSVEDQLGPEMAQFYAANPLVEAHIDAYNRYAFRPVDVRLVFFRASGKTVYGDLTKHLQHFDFGWSRYARRGVDIHVVPGTHATLASDPAALAQIGAQIVAYCDEAAPEP